MTRLIDVDALIEALNNSDAQFDAEVNRIILEQPTAYDVDRVVENLKEIEVGGYCRHKCKSYDWSVGACQGDCEDYIKSEAIDIVKRGEVNDIRRSN